jgi:hypothetical protein
MREETVKVRAKQGAGAVSYASWYHRLTLKPGEIADKWHNGSPITKAEFEALLKSHAFEIAPDAPAQPSAKGK